MVHVPSTQWASSTATIIPIPVSAVRVTDARWSSEWIELKFVLAFGTLINRTEGLTLEKLMPFKSAAKNLTSRTDAVRT